MKTTTTTIEWAHYTFNPWRGCAKVSAGYANCYAETLSKRNPSLLGHWGKGKPRVLASRDMWASPLKWDKKAKKEGARPRVFSLSLGDWLDDEVPIAWLCSFLKLIHSTPNLDWLLLTKRPQNWKPRLDAAHQFACYDEKHTPPHDFIAWLGDWVHSHLPPHNILLGTSVEDQPTADTRIPVLCSIPARRRFLSCEPLLGPLDIQDYLEDQLDGGYILGSAPIHWVIAGGESGPRAHPMHPAWPLSLRDQCQATVTPYLFKQWGEYLPLSQAHDLTPAKATRLATGWPGHTFPDGLLTIRVGKKEAGRHLDGQLHHAFPPATDSNERREKPLARKGG